MAESNLQSVAFPTLDEAQVADLAECTAAQPKRFGDGQKLFAVGERDFKFFIIKSGAVEIIDCSGDKPTSLTTHRQGQFTGDVTHLTGAPAVVSAVARGETEVYEVTGDALRRALNQCPVLSDIILQAFIARRQLLHQAANFTGRRVIGSRYSTVLCNSVIQRMAGGNHLAEIEISNTKTGQTRMVTTPGVFSFIGATPRTDWLPAEIERDAKGFVRTGADVARSPHWTARRQPFLLETSHPGVFAAGDVRSSSVKRVASAVGEGAMAVQFVHEYLKEM